MSHEIRTPMNGILRMSELLIYSDLNEQQKKYVETIKTSGDLLLALINDILDFSKIEAGELELERIPVIINALLSEIVQLMGSRACENNVEIAVRSTHDIPLSIWGDPIRLRQILINLVANAIKFSQGGHVLINIEKIHKNENQITLRFAVKDTGIGISEDKIDSIFEQFCQVDSSTTREFGGTGLGLAICKKLVVLMNGEIGVESKLGEGSTFWFEITSEVHNDNTQTELDIKRDLNNIKILAVDDYVVNLEIISEYMKNFGVECDTSPNPVEALKTIEAKNNNSSPYDVILIDYEMPEMDGEEMGKIISSDKDKYGEPKLILVTALYKSSKSEQLSNSGFSTKLLKPIYPKTLINTIINVTNEKPNKQHSNNHHINYSGLNIDKLKNINANILVVDDFAPNRDVIQNMLEKLECKVDMAINGIEALKKLEENNNKYDVILMDCQMPIMDGYETTKKIRSTSWGNKIPIIALTANALEGDKSKCLQANMNDYLCKPVKIKDLQQTIEKFVSNDDSPLKSSKS